MALAIKITNLSKAYQLGEIGTGTLAWDIERWFVRLLGKEDPFLKIGETNDRAKKGKSQIVWSLKDVNFEIKQGDAVGIIGRNGAGKSTLLKILSRVTSPTTGNFKVKGRIASLLEVGTGFHPELTGRENIYLNGAILGMRKKEILKKFDEIVDFAGVERYIDTPVKRYSSGMYVRLAFAVAAHLESEILIVDEVLAVGDAEFQKKCLGKMNDISSGEGRTVLFVSHNMGSVENLCKYGILLNQGNVQTSGLVQDVIQEYANYKEDPNQILRVGNREVEFHTYHLKNSLSVVKRDFYMLEDITLELVLKIIKPAKNLEISFNIKNNFGETISHITSFEKEIKFNTDSEGFIKLNIRLQKVNFVPGNYYFELFALDDIGMFDNIKECLHFTIHQSPGIIRPGGFPAHLKTYIPSDWSL